VVVEAPLIYFAGMARARLLPARIAQLKGAAWCLEEQLLLVLPEKPVRDGLDACALVAMVGGFQPQEDVECASPRRRASRRQR
jgi:hypothetical protein